MRFKEYVQDEFDAIDMHLHTKSRLLKDPNEGLAKKKHTRREPRSISSADM